MRKKRTWNILVVDDNLVDAVKVVQALHFLGDRVTLCLDGADALLETEYAHFDLVILDWRMPQVSGRDFLRSVNLDRGLQDPPLRVVVHSGEVIPSDDFPPASDRFDIVGVWRKSLTAADLLRSLNHLKGAA